MIANTFWQNLLVAPLIVGSVVIAIVVLFVIPLSLFLKASDESRYSTPAWRWWVAFCGYVFIEACVIVAYLMSTSVSGGKG